MKSLDDLRKELDLLNSSSILEQKKSTLEKIYGIREFNKSPKIGKIKSDNSK